MFGRIKKPIRKKKGKKRVVFTWEKDAHLQAQVEAIIHSIGFKHVQKARVFCYRTHGSRARAYARIWAFPKIFQEALAQKPAYVIEVLSEKFDRLSVDNKTKVLIHELLHIPKNFSGSLLPHAYGNKTIDLEVEKLYKMMKSK